MSSTVFDEWLSQLNAPVSQYLSLDERRRLADEEMGLFAKAHRALG